MNNDALLITPPQPERPRYVVRDAAYALEPQPPIDYIVESLITTGSVNLFYGEPGSKKTYSMLSMAVCVATGKPWLNMKTRPAKVLIVDEESGERRLSRRLGEAIRGELADGTISMNYVCLAGFRLDDKNEPFILQALIESTGAELVIIDALADVMGGDENSKQDTQPVFNGLRKISESTGAAINLIHHSNKAGGYRGSSAIKGAVDLMVQVTSTDGSKFVNFKTEKARDGEPVNFSAVATWVNGQFYLATAEGMTDKPHFTKSEAYVIRFLKEHTQATIDIITENADTCSPETARRAIYNLVEKGITKRVNQAGQGKDKVIYTLTEKGGNCEL